MRAGDKILKARKAKGWSQEELGWKLDVSVQAVSKWENNQSKPDKEHLVMLSKELGLSLEELMTDAASPGWTFGSPYFDPERMYTYVKARAQTAGIANLRAFWYDRRQKRKLFPGITEGTGE